MPTLHDARVEGPAIGGPSTEWPTACGEAPPSERLQWLADSTATLAESFHLTRDDYRAGLLDSLVVSLTDLAGELAGAELWDEVGPTAGDRVARYGRDFIAEYRLRQARMAARL